MPRLRRTSPDQPGWTRRRAGKGFTYLDERGRKLPEEEAQRARDLVIPPAWEDVWITPYENGHLQAVGTDDAGRRQYLYHPHWRERRDAEKFDRMLLFGKALARRGNGCCSTSASRECRWSGRARRRCGCWTSATSGSATTSTRTRTAPSVSPLSSAGTCAATRTQLVFAFVGKSGVEHEITIDDAVVIEAIEIMRRRRGGEDNRLLSYKTGRSWRSPAAGPGQRLRAGIDRAGGHGEGLPHLARHRAGGGRAGRDHRSRARPRPRASGRSPGR